MSKIISTKKIASNVFISVIAQAISLMVSLIANLFIPKFGLTDKVQYSLWQMFMLYQSYVGIVHFGLLDGMMLRYSKYDYEELDKNLLRSQMRVLLIFTASISLIMSAISLSFVGNTAYKIVFVLVAISITVKNLFTYDSYTFQMTNRISKYARLIILQRVLYAVIIVALLLFKVNFFYAYCLAEIACDLYATIISVSFNKDCFLGKGAEKQKIRSEIKENIGAGVLLLIAVWSFIFIVNGARMFIQWRWGDVVFGEVSLSFSISNMVLTFATAISVVLFPSLKRVEEKNLSDIYAKIRSILSVFLFFILLLYFPCYYFIKWWLPNYRNSLIYIGILFPIIVFSSKVNLLTNSYLKVGRKEKIMAIINVSSIVLGVGVFSVCAYLFNNLIIMLIGIIAVMVYNSLFAEICVIKMLNRKFDFNIVLEIVLTAVFLCSVYFLKIFIGALCYLLAFILYVAINYKSIKRMFSRVKTVNNNKQN
ncbi:MAG: hypothetical protein IJR66_05125 [Clostridia bacterium]|nr:hypothetical protein [Clostridia bacterium]